MRTIGEILQLSKEFLDKKGVSGARLQAEELLADLLACSRMDLYLDFDRPLQNIELDAYRERLKRRSEHEPTQYIRGFVEFYSCRIELSPAVLIPRQETEILLDLVVKRLEKQDLKGKVLWDVCCGSGCIAIALKKRFPDLTVFASDLSLEALEVAKKNADLNGVEVCFRQGDLFEPFSGESCHYFLSNPPYISESDYRCLEPEVSAFEPRGALLSGDTGFEFYERIAFDLKKHLRSGGECFLEMGTGQGEEIKKIFSLSGWQNFRVLQDWSSHDRFFFLEN
ncbi:MAG: protein-(glutamine-N5) methyltransferase, release factor-specific [Waddliaceae bacterium]|nr:protein-(glutamine-N5) methyltransferase, release factor-specific [Waddliaceae bacterium]